MEYLNHGFDCVAGLLLGLGLGAYNAESLKPCLEDTFHVSKKKTKEGYHAAAPHVKKAYDKAGPVARDLYIKSSAAAKQGHAVAMPYVKQLSNKATEGAKSAYASAQQYQASRSSRARAGVIGCAQGARPMTEKQMRLAVANWAVCAHPRCHDMFSSLEELEAVLMKVAMFINRGDDPILGPDGKCVLWKGSVTRLGGQAVLRMIRPGETTESVAFVNRVLVDIFATDESFDQLMQLPKEPFRMRCGNQRCVHLAHVSPAASPSNSSAPGGDGSYH